MDIETLIVEIIVGGCVVWLTVKAVNRIVRHKSECDSCTVDCKLKNLKGKQRRKRKRELKENCANKKI